MRSRLAAAAVLLGVTLAGCDKDSSGPDNSGPCGAGGTFTGTVTGAVSTTLSGCAVFGVTGTTSQSSFIGLNSGTAAAPTHMLSLSRNGARPPVGTHSIITDDFSGVFVFDGGIDPDRSFTLNTGTIEITTSTATTLTGTFSGVTGTGAAAATVTLNGSFSARCAPSASSSC